MTRFAASIFGRRWKMRRPVADEAPLRARKTKQKKKLYPREVLCCHAWGNKSVKLVKKKLWIYENHIWELRSEGLCEIILIIASYRRNFCSCNKKAWKKIGLYGNRTLERSAIPVQRFYLIWANKPTGSRLLSWFVISPLKDHDEVMNIWKSSNFFRLSFRSCKSRVFNCDDLLSYKTG